VAAVEIFIKGALPIAVAVYVLDIDRSSAYLIGPGLLTLAGNNWSVFLKLQGGRGIAVTGGTLLALAPILAAVCAVISIGGWKLTKSSGVWVLVSLTILPLWAYVFHDNLNLVWYCLGLLGIVVLKRLSANWTPFPGDISRKKVLFNRLVRDRDVADRTGWVRRMPEGSS
jgi:glycerol-3-phosphate acyltransferase PlsY